MSLPPCPTCGVPPSIQPYESKALGRSIGVAARCPKCGLSSGLRPTAHGAVRAWRKKLADIRDGALG